MREEDREHRAEEEDGEDREPEEGGAEEHSLVDEATRPDRLDRVGIDRLVRLVDPESVQAEERGREHEHDRKDTAAHALADGVAGDDDCAPQLLSPSTAST